MGSGSMDSSNGFALDIQKIVNVKRDRVEHRALGALVLLFDEELTDVPDGLLDRLSSPDCQSEKRFA